MPKVDPSMLSSAYARALAFARSRVNGRKWADSDLAEELAQEALQASFDPSRSPWKGDVPLERHVIAQVQGLLANRARLAKLRQDPKRAAAADEALKRPAFSADAGVRARDRKARHDARVEWALSQMSGTARDVLLLYLDEVFEATAQANILGKDVKQIYEARRRVAEVLRSAPTEPDSAPELAPSGGDDDDAVDATGTDDEAES